jgi:hypothetical protein
VRNCPILKIRTKFPEKKTPTKGIEIKLKLAVPEKFPELEREQGF